MPAITDFYSLPFDDEYKKMEQQEIEEVQNESEKTYRLALESGYFKMNIEELTKN